MLPFSVCCLQQDYSHVDVKRCIRSFATVLSCRNRRQVLLGRFYTIRRWPNSIWTGSASSLRTQTPKSTRVCKSWFHTSCQSKQLGTIDARIPPINSRLRELPTPKYHGTDIESAWSSACAGTSFPDANRLFSCRRTTSWRAFVGEVCSGQNDPSSERQEERANKGGEP